MRRFPMAIIVGTLVAVLLATPAHANFSEDIGQFPRASTTNATAEPVFGSTGNISLNKPIVGIAAKPDGSGYWEVATDGGVFAFGSAGFFGSTGALRLNSPIVGMASTKTGYGYWLVAADGGIFSFGDAQFYGSTGAMRLNQPIVGMAADPDGVGYWLVARDGGIFSFASSFWGSTGALTLNSPIVGMAADPHGFGYWLAAADGGVFAFNAQFFGSAGSSGLTRAASGIIADPNGKGYWITVGDGRVLSFGATGLGQFGTSDIEDRIIVGGAAFRGGYLVALRRISPIVAQDSYPRPPTYPSNPGDTKNCSDFKTQDAAQKWFETYFKIYGDVAHLDEDGDRIACELLP